MANPAFSLLCLIIIPSSTVFGSELEWILWGLVPMPRVIDQDEKRVQTTQIYSEFLNYHFKNCVLYILLQI